MNKRTLILFLFSLTLYSHGICQSHSVLKNDSLQIEQLNLKIDSLLDVTLKFNQEKNYFTTALNSQTMIFSIIVTVVLFLFGLVQNYNLKMEIKKYNIRNEIKIGKQNEIINEINTKSNNHNRLINKAMGNLNAMIATYYKKNDTMQFKFRIAAAKFQHLNDSVKPAISNLDSCYQITKKVDFDKIVKSIIDEDLEIKSVDESLIELINGKNEEIKRLSLNIYCKYIEVKQKLIHDAKTPNR